MLLHILRAGTESEIDAAFDTLVRLYAGALLVAADPFFNNRREQLVAQASRDAIPAICEWRESVVSGGLTSYGPSLAGGYRQVGILGTGRKIEPIGVITRYRSRSRNSYSTIRWQ